MEREMRYNRLDFYTRELKSISKSKNTTLDQQNRARFLSEKIWRINQNLGIVSGSE